MSVILAPGRLRQKDYLEFEANLDYSKTLSPGGKKRASKNGPISQHFKIKVLSNEFKQPNS